MTPKEPSGMIPSTVAALVTDLDGTLLDIYGRVPPLIAAAVSKLVDAGIAVIPATARPPRSVRSLSPLFTMAVCCNGALVIDLEDNTTLAETVFDPAALTRLVAAAQEQVAGLGFGLRQGDVLVANNSYLQLRSGPPVPARPVDRLHESDAQRVHGLALRAPGWTSDQLTGIVAPLLDGTGQLSLSSSSVLDVVPVGVSKVSGLQVLATRQGWHPDSAVGLGDMPNDLEMLHWVGWSAAPWTAHHDVLAAVHHIISDPVTHGIAALLQQLLPIDAR